MENANSVEKAFENAESVNSQEDLNLGTQQDDTVIVDSQEAEPDYKAKFSASSAEALRLLEETRLKDARIAELEALAEQGTQDETIENLYPDFDQLDPEAQRNLIAYTETVTSRVEKNLAKDPALAFARQTYNTTKWSDAFAEVAEKYPELKDSREEFKTKYFNPNAKLPDNITAILEDLAKVHLFDKARSIGAEDERQKAERIELERSTGGDKTAVASRSLEEWHKLQQENPAEFARQSKQYKTDLEAGNLKE